MNDVQYYLSNVGENFRIENKLKIFITKEALACQWEMVIIVSSKLQIWM